MSEKRVVKVLLSEEAAQRVNRLLPVRGSISYIVEEILNEVCDQMELTPSYREHVVTAVDRHKARL